MRCPYTSVYVHVYMCTHTQTHTWNIYLYTQNKHIYKDQKSSRTVNSSGAFTDIKDGIKHDDKNLSKESLL